MTALFEWQIGLFPYPIYPYPPNISEMLGVTDEFGSISHGKQQIPEHFQ